MATDKLTARLDERCLSRVGELAPRPIRPGKEWGRIVLEELSCSPQSICEPLLRSLVWGLSTAKALMHGKVYSVDCHGNTLHWGFVFTFPFTIWARFTTNFGGDWNLGYARVPRRYKYKRSSAAMVFFNFVNDIETVMFRTMIIYWKSTWSIYYKCVPPVCVLQWIAASCCTSLLPCTAAYLREFYTLFMSF